VNVRRGKIKCSIGGKERSIDRMRAQSQCLSQLFAGGVRIVGIL
jgi:hypothetical protein